MPLKYICKYNAKMEGRNGRYEYVDADVHNQERA